MELTNDTGLIFPSLAGIDSSAHVELCQSSYQFNIGTCVNNGSETVDSQFTGLRYSTLVVLKAFQLSQILRSSKLSCFVEVLSSNAMVLIEFDFSEGSRWQVLFEQIEQMLADASSQPETLHTPASIEVLDWIGTGLFIHRSDSLFDELKGITAPALCCALHPQQDLSIAVSYNLINGRLPSYQLAQYGSCFTYLCQQAFTNALSFTSLGEMWSDGVKAEFVKRTNPKSFDLTPVSNLPAQLHLCRQSKPDKTALVSGKVKVDFSELATAVEQVAAGLSALGVVKGDKVGAYMLRDIDWAILQIACMSMGAVYTPIDPSYPTPRVLHMLEQAEVKYLIFNNELPVELAQNISGISLHTYQSVPESVGIPLLDLAGMLASDAVAYIQFTSGSTGVPKGAMVLHQGMLNHIFAKILDLGLSADDVIAQTASQCFDVSLWQLLTGLYTQSTTVIYPDEVIWDIDDYMLYTQENAVTVLEVVPSYLDLLMEEQEETEDQFFADLLFLMVTGERVTLGQLSRWFEHYPDIPVINAYGPTEASDDITHFRIERGFEQPSVPIGFPIHNATIYILDEDQHLLPYGSAGEICVSGVCVGGGYINRPEETARAFMLDPVQPEPGRMMYRTGDIGRWLADGSLAFLGRNDQQVKVMGVRIELTEIEEVMSSIDGIKDTAVFCIEQQIVAVYSSLSASKIAESGLRDELRKRLPNHSLPSKLIHHVSMPLNANGKVDKNTLIKQLES